MTAKQTHLNLTVGFIDYEDSDTDTNLSFAIYEDGKYADSILLARSAYDRLLTDAEQGVRINYGDVLDDSVHPILLQEAVLQDVVIELICESHRFTLDLSKIEDTDLETITSMLKKLNVDDRFVLRINGSEQQTATDHNRVVALCWYQPEEWKKLRDSAADAERLDDTYNDWKKNANDMITFVRAAGRKIQKIKVKIEDLDAWCKEEGIENNATARSRYATAIARQRTEK